MSKNGEHNVVDFVCAKGRQVDIYAGSRRHSCNLTNMRRSASVRFGIRMAIVPESYHRASALVLSKLPSCLCHRFLLHIVFETMLNLSENIALIALESYACKRMDLKQLRG
jgi:hypothetical protein